MIWTRSQARALLTDVGEIRDCGAMGDYDIPGLTIRPYDRTGGEAVTITPFVDPIHRTPKPKCITDTTEVDVFAIEVRTDGDCTGGCQTEDEELAKVYGVVTARLRKAGHHVIPHYDAIF